MCRMLSWHPLHKWRPNVPLFLTCLSQTWISTLWILNWWMPLALYIHNFGCNLMVIYLFPYILMSSRDTIVNWRNWNPHWISLQNLWILISQDFQQSIFKLVMKAWQTPKAMAEPFDANPMTQVWVTINNNHLLTKWQCEHMKLVEIIIVSMHGFVEELFPLLPPWKTNHTMGWCNTWTCTLYICIWIFWSRFLFLLGGYYILVLSLRPYVHWTFVGLVFSWFGQELWLCLFHHEFY